MGGGWGRVLFLGLDGVLFSVGGLGRLRKMKEYMIHVCVSHGER